VVLLVYIILAVIADQIGQPFQTPDTRLLPVVRYGNMAITAAVLIALSAFYQAAVARAERYMQHYSSTLEKLSNMDPLTGILNRRGTVAALDYALALGSRNGTDTAVILLDLDHFKSINDKYGHETGDDVLKKIAEATGKVVRGSDCVGRWGGEEFLAVLPAANETGAENVAERIRDEIGRVSVTIPEGGTVPVTATVGVAVHRPGERPATATLSPAETRTALIFAADTAMYSGKAAGRNCVACAPRPDVPQGG
jgi:diguanylate cyclase (GGDEF)-like protein